MTAPAASRTQSTPRKSRDHEGHGAPRPTTRRSAMLVDGGDRPEAMFRNEGATHNLVVSTEGLARHEGGYDSNYSGDLVANSSVRFGQGFRLLRGHKGVGSSIQAEESLAIER